jgi:signal transduction histidine kinase
VTIFTDVTERRRAEAERERLLASEREARAAAEVTARRADALAAETAALVRQKDEVVASISHDLQQPMTAILGFVRLLLRQVRRGETVAPERLELLLDQIEQTGARMSGQIQELLDAAQIERGRPLELRRAPVDLVELVRAVVEELRESAGQRALSVEALEAALPAQVDARRVRRALANLVSNAIKYSPEESEVLVRVGRDPAAPASAAAIEVRDQGIGIPADDLPRLFERFFRARNALDQAVGTGLGLAGARAIVEQHGGQLEVESEEGRGSTFRIRLPLARAAPRERDERESSALPSG